MYGDVLGLIGNTRYSIRKVKCLVVCIIGKGLNYKITGPFRKKNSLFSDVFKREYPFLINNEIDANKVRCTLCKNVLSISHGVRTDIEKNNRANKHEKITGC
jgi:hypothetical protein